MVMLLSCIVFVVLIIGRSSAYILFEDDKNGNLRGGTTRYQHNGITEIPKIIFRTNESPSHKHLHDKFHGIFSNSLATNPEFVQVYFSNSARIAFIRRHFPAYLPLYQKLIPGAFKADFFRLLIIYKYGGIYADSAINFIKGISGKFIQDLKTDEFVGTVDLDNTAMFNAVFASYPRHPIIAHMIKWVANNIYYERYGCNDLDITGPKALGRAFHAYMNYSLTFPLMLGKHEKNGFRYHFHQFHITQKITTSRNEEIIHNKFDGYHEHQYKKSKPYGELYKSRRVFFTSDLNSMDSVHQGNPNINAYEGSLIRKNAHDEFWIVIGKKKYGFPSRQVFRNMGMEVCTFCSADNNDVTKQIPYIGNLPDDSHGYWRKYMEVLPSIDRNSPPRAANNRSDLSPEKTWVKLQDFIQAFKKNTVDAEVFVRFMDSDSSVDWSEVLVYSAKNNKKGKYPGNVEQLNQQLEQQHSLMQQVPAHPNTLSLSSIPKEQNEALQHHMSQVEMLTNRDNMFPDFPNLRGSVSDISNLRDGSSTEPPPQFARDINSNIDRAKSRGNLIHIKNGKVVCVKPPDYLKQGTPSGRDFGRSEQLNQPRYNSNNNHNRMSPGDNVRNKKYGNLNSRSRANMVLRNRVG